MFRQRFPHWILVPEKCHICLSPDVIFCAQHGIIKGMIEEQHERARAILGDAGFERLVNARIAIFGVGGVGGWCAEALLRSGACHLALIDDDHVAASNINRQRQALPSTIGDPKADALRDMLLAVAPDACITAHAVRYTPANAASFDTLIAEADVVIDAIDTVDCKAHLIRHCLRLADSAGRPTLLSSLGAALRTDPTRIRTAPFHKVAGDGLARALRNRFRKDGAPIPRHICVYSEEPPLKMPPGIKGSIMPVTCGFGMALAALALAAIREAPRHDLVSA